MEEKYVWQWGYTEQQREGLIEMLELVSQFQQLTEVSELRHDYKQCFSLPQSVALGTPMCCKSEILAIGIWGKCASDGKGVVKILTK